MKSGSAFLIFPLHFNTQRICMKQKLMDLFMSKIVESAKTPQEVSSYSLIRTGTGSWSMKIYWKGKAKSKVQASIVIKLNNDIEATIASIHAMEQIIENGTKVDIDFGQKAKKERGTGW